MSKHYVISITKRFYTLGVQILPTEIHKYIPTYKYVFVHVYKKTFTQLKEKRYIKKITTVLPGDNCSNVNTYRIGSV